ncbi:MAG TPA: tetratricopeptide repeat protein [Longimicrobium sp.]
MTASPAQVKQWTDELAADPASTAFLPLARAYRDSGKREAALRLVLRGLERHPHHVDAHHLLGLLYRDAGDNVRAADEWGIALALAPEHPGARREMGLAAFARGDWASAVKHLEQAQANDVMDQEVRAALESAWQRSRVAARAAPPSNAPAPAPEAPRSEQWDGGRIFDALAAELAALSQERGIVGAVMLDAQGFVIAGRIGAERDRAGEISAVLSGASSEAERAVRHLKLGAWKGILVETPQAVVRLAPTGDGGMVAVAGRRDVPMGWVLRVAARARESAERFLAAIGGAR